MIVVVVVFYDTSPHRFCSVLCCIRFRLGLIIWCAHNSYCRNCSRWHKSWSTSASIASHLILEIWIKKCSNWNTIYYLLQLGVKYRIPYNERTVRSIKMPLDDKIKYSHARLQLVSLHTVCVCVFCTLYRAYATVQ